MYTQTAFELKQSKASSDVDCSPRLMLQAFQKNQQKSELPPPNVPVFYNGKQQTYLQGNQQLAVSSKLKPTQNTVHYSQMNLADIHALEQQQKYLNQVNQNFTTVTAAVGGQIASNQHTRDKVMKNVIHFNQSSKSANNNPNNHQTLQCLSQIDQFKQKVNMVLQSQAFPGNQNTGVFQNQKYSIKEGQGVVTGQKIAQNVGTGETTPQAMQHKNEIDLVQEQRNFLAWKNQLKSNQNHPRMEQAQLDNVLSNQQLVSSKDQQRNNHYQHLQKQGAQDDEGTIASNSLMTTPSGTRSSNQQSMAHQHINQSIQNGHLYSNSYVQNNLKQQQRRKLLLEYSQENNVLNQEIKSSQQQRNKKNMSHGGSDTVSREKDPEVVSEQQQGLIESLKKLDIAALEDKEREKLRFLSLQYQFHLQQYEEQHKAAYSIQPIQPINKAAAGTKQGDSSQPSIMSLKSNDGENNKQQHQSQKQQTVSRMMRLNSQVDQNNSGAGVVSDYQQGKSFQSDRFIDNEKNLSEDRLKKQWDQERDPLPVVSQFSIKNNSELNQKTPVQNKDAPTKEFDQTQQDLQGSQSDSNLKKSFNSNGIKRENSQFLSAKQNHENDGKGPEGMKALFNSEANKIQYQNTEIQSVAVNSLQNFIENLSLGDKKKSNVMSLQNHQIQLQEPDTSASSKGKGNLRQNEVANLYNKYNKVYQQVDHHKNGAGYLRKSEGVNCPKPTPQQILNMNNSSQRLNLFKILQAKEHIKFQNIQNEKIQQLQQLQEQQELSSQENPKQFMDFIQRKQGANKKGVFTVNQYQQKQLQNLKNIQQLKTLQKQQLNDQKAFGIFQMNELAQFKSMSDQNQKQILLNNLQQGKFEDLGEDPTQLSPPQQKPSSVQRSLQNDQSQRFHQQSRAQNIQSREKQQLSEQQNDYQQLSPNSNIEKTIEIKVNELNKNMYQPQIMQQAKLNQSVFDNAGSNYATEENQSKKALQQSVKGSITGSIAEIQCSEPNSAQSQDVQQSLHVIRNPQLNQIQRRYEESKMQFEACLRETITKQQSDIDQLVDSNSRFSKGGVNIDNILPGFSQRLVNGAGSEEKPEEKYRTRIKTRAGISMSNTNKNANKLKISCGKEDEKNGVGPESTKNGTQKKLADGKQEEIKEGEEPEKVPEVKRVPRYFPPRKMPNPFEEQANEQDRFMQARKDALAKYSNISKNRFKQGEQDPLKYVIKPGNNSKLIMRVLEKSGRLEPKGYNPGWEAADDNLDSLYNFKWKPTSAGLKYDLISKHGLKQVVNHVKGHYQITTKDNLFLNIKAFYESQKQNVFDIVPLTIVLDYLKDDVGERMEMFMNLHKILEKNINEDFEEINKKMYAYQQAKEKSIKTAYKINRCCQSGENLWLLKPTGFNRGIGIHIFQTFDQLREIMSESYGIGRGVRDKMSIFQTHNHNHIARGDGQVENEKEKLKSFTFVIQKLIEKPLLYHNRKFDIRVWAILNSYDGKFYCFKESYVRTSSKEYKQYDPDVPNEEQIFMQLTNNAVQNTGEEYGKYEEGNITSCDTLFRHVSETEFGQGKTKHELLEQFNADKNKQMIDSIKSIKGKISHQKHTFELFGYDFILDEDLNTVLIEVNTNPCLEESNNLLKHMLPRMVDDCLNIMMDPIFANGSGTENAVNRQQEKYKSAFNLPGEVFVVDQKEKPSGDDMHPGYKLDENLFEHLYTMEI